MDITQVIDQFSIEGTLQDLKANREGLINNTYISTFTDGAKYTHQRLNRSVFTNPEAVMQNILLVTTHLQEQVAHLPDASQRALQLVPTKKGRWWTYDEEGELWRTYRYIDEVKTYSHLRDTNLAYKFGVAVATFQKQLANFDGAQLTETIVDFHHMGKRYEQFTKALAEDPVARASSVQAEVDFFLANQERAMRITDAFAEGEVPVRVTHNDTKINNVLFDCRSGEGICVIDLDTVMPGTLLFDTGDMIRTGCATVSEDEKDLSLVHFDPELYTSLIQGYRSVADLFLTERERLLIGESGRAITLIMALRMFTDYLLGDRYYFISYPKHNLVRAQNQIKLIQSMDESWEKLLKACE